MIGRIGDWPRIAMPSTGPPIRSSHACGPAPTEGIPEGTRAERGSSLSAPKALIVRSSVLLLSTLAGEHNKPRQLRHRAFTAASHTLSHNYCLQEENYFCHILDYYSCMDKSGASD